MRKLLIILTATVALTLTGCGYNTFQTTDEQVKASWSEVINQYQRRADLVPNLVATVKGEAKFEQDTLTKVIEARSKATSIQANFAVENEKEISKPPSVGFDTTPAKPAGTASGASK